MNSVPAELDTLPYAKLYNSVGVQKYLLCSWDQGSRMNRTAVCVLKKLTGWWERTTLRQMVRDYRTSMIKGPRTHASSLGTDSSWRPSKGVASSLGTLPSVGPEAGLAACIHQLMESLFPDGTTQCVRRTGGQGRRNWNHAN